MIPLLDEKSREPHIVNFGSTTVAVGGAPDGLGFTAAGTFVANATVANTLAGAVAVNNALVLIRGNYTGGTTNTFVGNAAGDDTLVIYDADTAAGATVGRAFVMEGYFDSIGTAVATVAGVWTLA